MAGNDSAGKFAERCRILIGRVAAIAIVNELAALEHWLYGRQMWTVCKVRKVHRCVCCDEIHNSGDIMFRPITNAGNRYYRVCQACATREWFGGQCENGD